MCVLILHLHPKHFSLFISSSLSLSFDSVSAHLLLLFLSCWTKKKTFKGVVLHPHKKKVLRLEIPKLSAKSDCVVRDVSAFALSATPPKKKSWHRGGLRRPMTTLTLTLTLTSSPRGGRRHQRRQRASSTTTAAARRRRQQQEASSTLSQHPSPGSMLSRMVNLQNNTINWEALEKTTTTSENRHAEETGGVFGLIRGELEIKTKRELKERRFGYKEFVLLRTLGLKAHVLASCFRAKNVETPIRKCSVGRILADPGSKAEESFYGLYSTCADAMSGEDDGSALTFMDRVVGKIEKIAEEKLDDEFVSKSKNRYGKEVDEETFEKAYGGNAGKAVEFVFNNDGHGESELVLDVPNFDLPENVGSALAGGSETKTADNDGDDEPFAFGKKSKKKKKKAPTASVVSDAMKSVAGGQKSTLEALSDLITTQAKKKKQQEPTFPEFSNWGQSTSAEGMGILLTICLALGAESRSKNSRLILVLPSDLILSALFFDRDPYILGNKNKKFAVCATEAHVKALSLEEESTEDTILARIRIEGAPPSFSDERLDAALEGDKVKKIAKLALRLA